jgi:ATP-dependent RNA helicase DDX3X
VPHDVQIKEFKNGCDILVSTPGRLIDYLKSGVVTLSLVKYFIIDEADRILDMGFEPQLQSITFEHDLREKRKRLNLLFSATFTPEVREIAKKFMNDYYFITKNKDEENHVNENIKQVLVQAEEQEKLVKLHTILQQINGSVISNIFKLK